MKSLMITKYGDINSSLEEQDIPKPLVEANQILIRTYSSSFNPIDQMIVKGDYKAMGKVSFPAGIGRDVSGIVEEVGKNVTAVFAESNANFKKIKKICFQKIANRRDRSATTKGAILEVHATPTKRGHF